MIESFANAFRGIALCLQYERNMRVHFVATCYVVYMAYRFYELTRAEWIVLILTCSAVVTSEAVNTAIELLTDKASPEYSALAGAAKDTAAGAVLLASIAAIIVGFVLFWDLDTFAVVTEHFVVNTVDLIILIITVVLSVIFVRSGKRRRKRGVRK